MYNLEQERTSIFTTRVCDTPFLIAITIRKPKRSNTQHVSCTNQQVGSKRAANDKKDASNALEKYSSAD
jgi:hypothetical protein